MVSVRTTSPPTVHTAYLQFLCDKCDCSTLDLDSWNSSWSISLVWKSTWEEKEDTVDCCSRKPSFLNAEYLSIVTSHPRCSSKCNLTKKSLLAQTSPALQPLSLAFCQLPKVSGVIIWPKLPKTTAGANIKLSLKASTCFVLSLGRHASEKKKPMALHLLSGSV